MSNTLRENLLRQLEQTEEAYTQELENSGSDTEQCRQQIAGLKRDLAGLDADEAGRQQLAEEEIEAAMTDQAEIEAQTAKDALRNELRELSELPVPEISLPLGIAMNVQRAGRALQAAREAEAAAKSEHDNRVQRFQKHESKRQNIISRRAAGNGNDDADKADLLMAADDMEGLRPLIAKALTTLQQSQAASQQAQAAFDQAVSQWGDAINVERDRCKQLVCERLDAQLVRAQSLSTQRVGMSVVGYIPSQELRQLVGRF